MGFLKQTRDKISASVDRIIDNRKEIKLARIEGKQETKQQENLLNAELSAEGKELIGKNGRQKDFGKNMLEGSKGFMGALGGLFNGQKSATTNKYGAIAIAGALGIMVVIILIFKGGKKKRK